MITEHRISTNNDDTMKQNLREIIDKMSLPDPDTMTSLPQDIRYFIRDTITFNTTIDTFIISTKEDKFVIRLSDIKQINSIYTTKLSADIYDKSNNNEWLNQSVIIEVKNGKVCEINTNKCSIYLRIENISFGKAIVGIGIRPLYSGLIIRNLGRRGNCMIFRRIVSRNRLNWINKYTGHADGVRPDGTTDNLLIFIGDLSNSLDYNVRFDSIQIKYLLSGKWYALKGVLSPPLVGNSMFDTTLDLQKSETIIGMHKFVSGKILVNIPDTIKNDWNVHKTAKFRFEIKAINNDWHFSEFNVYDSYN